MNKIIKKLCTICALLLALPVTASAGDHIFNNLEILWIKAQEHHSNSDIANIPIPEKLKNVSKEVQDIFRAYLNGAKDLTTACLEKTERTTQFEDALKKLSKEQLQSILDFMGEDLIKLFCNEELNNYGNVLKPYREEIELFHKCGVFAFASNFPIIGTRFSDHPLTKLRREINFNQCWDHAQKNPQDNKHLVLTPEQFGKRTPIGKINSIFAAFIDTIKSGEVSFKGLKSPHNTLFEDILKEVRTGQGLHKILYFMGTILFPMFEDDKQLTEWLNVIKSQVIKERDRRAATLTPLAVDQYLKDCARRFSLTLNTKKQAKFENLYKRLVNALTFEQFDDVKNSVHKKLDDFLLKHSDKNDLETPHWKILITPLEQAQEQNFSLSDEFIYIGKSTAQTLYSCFTTCCGIVHTPHFKLGCGAIGFMLLTAYLLGYRPEKTLFNLLSNPGKPQQPLLPLLPVARSNNINSTSRIFQLSPPVSPAPQCNLQ